MLPYKIMVDHGKVLKRGPTSTVYSGTKMSGIFILISFSFNL